MVLTKHIFDVIIFRLFGTSGVRRFKIVRGDFLRKGMGVLVATAYKSRYGKQKR